MKKIDAKIFLLWLIALAAFHLAAFVVPFTRAAGFWVAYATTLVCFALVGMGYIRAVKQGQTVSRLLGWPILKATLSALCVQLVVGLAVMAVCTFAAPPSWIIIIVEAVLVALTVALMLTRGIARDMVETVETKQAPDTAAMKALRKTAATLSGRAAGASRAALRKLSDDLSYSDPVSSDATREKEAQLNALFARIEETLSGKQDISALTERASQILKARNAAAKDGKKA